MGFSNNRGAQGGGPQNTDPRWAMFNNAQAPKFTGQGNGGMGQVNTGTLPAMPSGTGGGLGYVDPSRGNSANPNNPWNPAAIQAHAAAMTPEDRARGMVNVYGGSVPQQLPNISPGQQYWNGNDNLRPLWAKGLASGSPMTFNGSTASPVVPNISPIQQDAQGNVTGIRGWGGATPDLMNWDGVGLDTQKVGAFLNANNLMPNQFAAQQYSDARWGAPGASTGPLHVKRFAPQRPQGPGFFRF